MKTYLLVTGIIVWLGRYSYQTPLPAHSKVDKVEQLIKRRNLRSVGYTHFDVSYLHETGSDDILPANIVNSEVLRRRKREIDSTGASAESTFRLNAHGETFVLNVKHTAPVLHPTAKILFTSNNYSEAWQGTNPDCFMTGKLTSHDYQTAVFSFCNNLKGFFSDKDYTYWVESLEHHDDSPYASSYMVVARKPASMKRGPDPLLVQEKANRKVDVKRSAELDTVNKHHRAKRLSTRRETIEIEIAVVADETATAVFDQGGATTDAERIEMLTMKWSGVKAEYENPNTFYMTFASVVEIFIDVTISVKAMEFWTTNPGWLTVNTNLLPYLENLCGGFNTQGLYLDFDHVFIETGLKGTDTAGKAFNGDVCSSTRKCALSAVPDPSSYWIEEHELGHNLNMIHDYEQPADSPCRDPNDGIMGNNYHGWTSCSTTALYNLINDVTGRSACLKQTNVDTTAITLHNQWPGMVFTDDEVCALKNKPGWRYRPVPQATPSPCPTYSCVDMNPLSNTYGLMRGKYINTIMGRRCGSDMYCYVSFNPYKNQCISWADTGLDNTLKTTVTGGWSSWSAQTSCSRTCGTGVQIRQRFCNNPKPQHSPWCEGSEYETELCNQAPCNDDDEATLVTQRANEACTWLNANNLIGTAYENTGRKYSSIAHGQCEVKCDLKAGETSDRTRFGLIPDGTPCSDTAVDDDVEELYKLPRRSGRSARCLQGYCYVFGCDDITQTDLTSFDGCGRCGGSETTCTVHEDIFVDDVPSQQTVDLITVPAGATLIQIWFPKTDNPNYQIELWSADNVPIIESSSSSNLDSPTNHAGTDWYYKSDEQFLYAIGPIAANVTIKVSATATESNQGIQYGYSIPIPGADTTTTPSVTTSSSATTTTCSDQDSCSVGNVTKHSTSLGALSLGPNMTRTGNCGTEKTTSFTSVTSTTVSSIATSRSTEAPTTGSTSLSTASSSLALTMNTTTESPSTSSRSTAGSSAVLTASSATSASLSPTSTAITISADPTTTLASSVISGSTTASASSTVYLSTSYASSANGSSETSVPASTSTSTTFAKTFSSPVFSNTSSSISSSSISIKPITTLSSTTTMSTATPSSAATNFSVTEKTSFRSSEISSLTESSTTPQKTSSTTTVFTLLTMIRTASTTLVTAQEAQEKGFSPPVIIAVSVTGGIIVISLLAITIVIVHWRDQLQHGVRRKSRPNYTYSSDPLWHSNYKHTYSYRDASMINKYETSF